MERRENIGRRSVRIVVELTVIVAGVLIALAADRWNEARADRVEESAYLERFVEEIRQDSIRAVEYLQMRPSILAGLDSLISFFDGGTPPENVVGTLISVSNELSLQPVSAWIEIQASNSLHLITDPEVRAALTTYYGRRDRILLLWSRQDSRGRDPLWDELYRTGLFDPMAEHGAPTTLDLDSVRSWPGMRELLLALGAGHYFQRNNAEGVQRAAGTALRTLPR